jgi:predicted dithiol-disulfide oxidoreductase (DUF899 family)
MKGSHKGWQKKWISSSDGTSNDAIKGKLDHKQAAAGRVFWAFYGWQEHLLPSF